MSPTVLIAIAARRGAARASRRVLALVVAVSAAACTSSVPPGVSVTGGVVRDDSAPVRETVMRPGELVTARYRVRNIGGRDLLLHGLTPACGCRLASLVPDALAAGEETSVAVRCRAPRSGGDVVREIRLHSNDPAHPAELLRVPMTVSAGTGSDPTALYFGYVPVGGSSVREIVIASTSPPVTSDPALTVEPRPPRPDGRPVHLIRFAPRAPGVMRASLTLAGGEEIPVLGVGFQTLLAFPPELVPSGVTAGGATRAIAIKAIGDTPLEIARVEFPPDLTGELTVTTPGREWRLAVHVRGPRMSDPQPIRIHTNAATEPVLVIPVHRPDST